MPGRYVVFAKKDVLREAGIDSKTTWSMRELWKLPDGAYVSYDVGGPRTLEDLEKTPGYQMFDNDPQYVKMYLTIGN